MLYSSYYPLSSGCMYSNNMDVEENKNEIFQLENIKSIKNYKHKTQCDGCGAPVQKSYWSCNYCGRDYW